MSPIFKKAFKILGIILLIIILLTIVAGFIGIRKFNNSWFKERPNYLSYTSEEKSMNFEWAKETYGGYTEPHVALIIPVSFEGISHRFYLQFDTGSPTTFFYGNTISSLQKMGIDLKQTSKDENKYIEQINLNIGGNYTQMNTIEVLENYGSSFEAKDSIQRIKIGTIGSDFLDQHITQIDFKNQMIQCYNERPNWMEALPDFKPFSFKGRRLMLPVEINGKKMELFYDSGCSAFGIITSKQRYDKYTDKNDPEISYEGNRFGEALTVYHKNSDETISIGNANLQLKRISYVDIYAKFQSLMSPFTKIGGWLGNKPFIDHTLIIDTQKESFIVIESPTEINEN